MYMLGRGFGSWKSAPELLKEHFVVQNTEVLCSNNNYECKNLCKVKQHEENCNRFVKNGYFCSKVSQRENGTFINVQVWWKNVCFSCIY